MNWIAQTWTFNTSNIKLWRLVPKEMVLLNARVISNESAGCNATQPSARALEGPQREMRTRLQLSAVLGTLWITRRQMEHPM